MNAFGKQESSHAPSITASSAMSGVHNFSRRARPELADGISAFAHYFFAAAPGFFAAVTGAGPDACAAWITPTSFVASFGPSLVPKTTWY